jgi:polyhydroxyalkanoate synthase subunit PhaC
MTDLGKPRRRKPRTASPETSTAAPPSFPSVPRPSKPRGRPARPRRAEAAIETPEIRTLPAVTGGTDRLVHAFEGRLTGGLSPASLMQAFFDWLVHLTNSVGKVNELGQNALAKGLRFALYAARLPANPDGEAFIEPLAQDTRFTSPAWRTFPYSLYYQSFLMVEQWWHYATTGVRGVSRHNQDVVSFTARQFLDVMSPSNFPLTNPDVVKATIQQGGLNLINGARNWFDDAVNLLAGRPPGSAGGYEPGANLACTPGKVIFRNHLMELIQYAPATRQVQAEPVLIVPAWIMKYYILDLSPHNSFVGYLLSRGHTVFMVSWRNPGAGERDLGMADYLRQGIGGGLDAITAICPGRQVHLIGYCLGGTLAAIAAAAMARDGDDRLRSLTLLAAQTDFEEAGEIMLFIDESQVTFLEDMMWDQGYLDTKQMAGAFQMLRSNDLIWSRLVREYLFGEQEHPNDLMAWNADATRMPYRMHSEYLRHLFLDNDLSKGRYRVEGQPVALTDIRVPICAVGTTKDHVAPWKSVFKIMLLTDTEVTFILTSGGHNAGIVSEPGHPRRSFQMSTHQDLDRYIDPDSWARVAPAHDGSWWPALVDWLAQRSSGWTAPPRMGQPTGRYAVLCDAPGDYVLMR